ncbi:MAG: phosphoribosylformylglycinamidine cyclo-ligase [Sulfobacillus sp.]
MSEDVYRQAGVDVRAGDEAVRRYQQAAGLAWRPEVMGGIGHFAGLFALGGGTGQVLVAGADGVGSKLLLASQLNAFDDIGVDLVAMVVNDVLTAGARPLFVLDYLAVDRLDPVQAGQVVASVARGCREAGCALLGGETAELPDMLRPGVLDLAGFAVGVVDSERMISGDAIRPGHRVVGIASHGFHANGYSLIRKIVKDFNLDLTVPRAPGLPALGAELLVPTRIYVGAVHDVLGLPLSGLAHVTGGGLGGNLVRILPDHCRAVIDQASWAEPELCQFIRQTAGLSREAVRHVFNLGIGFLLVAPAEVTADLIATLVASGESAVEVGWIEAGARAVLWQ